VSHATAHTAKSSIVVVLIAFPLASLQAPVPAAFDTAGFVEPVGMVHVPPVGLHVKVGMAVSAVAPAAHVTVETEAA